MAKTKKRSVADLSVTDHGASGDASHVGDPRDRIAIRAYELYLARGAADGGDFDDWIAAERELTGTNAPTGSDRDE